jgi:DNA invertase Pin-like site-specific DNA recombinase
MTYTKDNTIKRAAIYIRVSTDGQTVDNQRLELEQAAKNAGWEIVGIYDDNGVSGAKSREQR